MTEGYGGSGHPQEVAVSTTDTPPVQVPLETSLFAPPPPHRSARLARWLGPEISRRSAGIVLGAWALATVLLPVLEPAPAHPETSIWATLLGAAMTVGLFAVLAGLAIRRRAGLWVSAATAVVSIAAAVMCPISGHHRFGAWWLAEMAVLGGVAVATERALRRG